MKETTKNGLKSGLLDSFWYWFIYLGSYKAFEWMFDLQYSWFIIMPVLFTLALLAIKLKNELMKVYYIGQEFEKQLKQNKR